MKILLMVLSIALAASATANFIQALRSGKKTKDYYRIAISGDVFDAEVGQPISLSGWVKHGEAPWHQYSLKATVEERFLDGIRRR